MRSPGPSSFCGASTRTAMGSRDRVRLLKPQVDLTIEANRSCCPTVLAADLSSDGPRHPAGALRQRDDVVRGLDQRQAAGICERSRPRVCTTSPNQVQHGLTCNRHGARFPLKLRNHGAEVGNKVVGGTTLSSAAAPPARGSETSPTPATAGPIRRLRPRTQRLVERVGRRSSAMVTTRPTTAWALSATTMQSVVVRRRRSGPSAGRRRAGCRGCRRRGSWRPCSRWESEPLRPTSCGSCQHPRARVRHRRYRLPPHRPFVDPTAARVIAVFAIFQLDLDDDLSHDDLQAPLSQRQYTPLRREAEVVIRKSVVEPRGLEPLTSAVQGRRSPS